MIPLHRPVKIQSDDNFEYREGDVEDEDDAEMVMLVMVNKGLWFKFITSVSLLLGGMNRIGELRCL